MSRETSWLGIIVGGHVVRSHKSLVVVCLVIACGGRQLLCIVFLKVT